MSDFPDKNMVQYRVERTPKSQLPEGALAVLPVLLAYRNQTEAEG
jgi:hypothetical protein